MARLRKKTVYRPDLRDLTAADLYVLDVALQDLRRRYETEVEQLTSGVPVAPDRVVATGLTSTGRFAAGNERHDALMSLLELVAKLARHVR